jgi:hypothetical protein
MILRLLLPFHLFFFLIALVQSLSPVSPIHLSHLPELVLLLCVSPSSQLVLLVTHEGPFDFFTRHKEAFLTFLGISTKLPNQDLTLCTAYVKYKVLVSSAKKMLNLWSNQEWTDHLEEFGIEHWISVFADLSNIFIAKSQFYVSWKPSFKIFLYSW